MRIFARSQAGSWQSSPVSLEELVSGFLEDSRYSYLESTARCSNLVLRT